MRWSKLKKLIETNFVDAVKPHVSIHSTAYGACGCGHAWMVLDGKIIANFCTRAYYNRYFQGDKAKENEITPEQRKKFAGQFVDYGEMSRQDVYKACWEFIHDLAFDDAMKSDDPLIQSLMVLDKRLGKRRIVNINQAKLHPLAKKLLGVRKAFEAKKEN